MDYGLWTIQTIGYRLQTAKDTDYTEYLYRVPSRVYIQISISNLVKQADLPDLADPLDPSPIYLTLGEFNLAGIRSFK